MSAEVAKEAKAVAVFILKERRLKPTKELVAKVMALPKVRQEAERRVRFRKLTI